MPEQQIEALRAFIENAQAGHRSLGEHIAATYCVKLVAANRLKADQDENKFGYAGGLIVSADCPIAVAEAVTFLIEHGLHEVCGTRFFEVTELGEIGGERSDYMPFSHLFGVRLSYEIGSSDMVTP